MTGGSGSGRSAWMLYQASGICFSFRRNFVFSLIGGSFPRWEPERTPPGRAASHAGLALVEPPVQAIDEVGHLLEPVGDSADAVLAKVLCSDAERSGEPLDDL